jgi:hypothetical protein
VFKKFFGKKNDGFYLQVEDDKAAPKSEAKAKAPAKPESVSTPAPAVAVAAAATPVAAAATPVAPVAKADKKAAKTDKKSAKKAEAPKVVTVPVTVAAPAAPAITNFATDYLIKPSSISSRRLPGANMNGFLELARQVKKPVNIK